MTPMRSVAADPPSPIDDGLKHCPILIVDDIEWNRVLIGGLLSGAGFQNLRYAADGDQALASIEKDAPELVLLDIMMPGLDGFEVCRRLRADSRYVDLPILVQTALTNVDDRNRAFEAGTTDLICKPLDRAELVARIRIHLENRLLLRDLRRFHERVASELMMANSVYEHLLPNQGDLDQIQAAIDVRIRSQMIQSSDLSGDVWNAWLTENGEVVVYLLDMAGRGLAAALNVCRLHTLIQDLGDWHEPADVLVALNTAVRGLLNPGEYAKVLLGVIDRSNRCFRYATAAASHPILLAPDGTTIVGSSAGLPIGATATVSYEERVLPFAPGSTILLASNALFDVYAGANDPADVVAALLASTWGRGLDALFKGFSDAVGDQPSDDHTAILIEWPGHETGS